MSDPYERYIENMQERHSEAVRYDFDDEDSDEGAPAREHTFEGMGGAERMGIGMEESECYCHLAPPCGHCTSQPDPDHGSDQER